ncbi:MAG: insulinase family protein [Bacteroidetes bacterium]|nr:insulinase family protein [Bacteroidota bacterium]
MTDPRDIMPDRRRPPRPGVPKDVTFPDYFEHTLANGIKVIVYEDHSLPIAAVNVVTRGGSYFDGAQPGLASMSAELLTKGTATRSATDVVEEIEFLGGSIGSGAGWDSMSVGISILARHLENAMDVLADTVRQPSFPAEEVERVREQRLTDILQSKSSPSSLAYERFNAAVYGSHPYGLPQDGTTASVTALQPEQLHTFHERRFVAGNMFITAVGDVTPDAMVEMATRLFGDMDGSAIAPPEETAVGLPATRLVQVVDRPSAVQSSILIGHTGIARDHDEFIAVYLLNMLLGGYFGSRLNLNLREDKGYTYGAHAHFDARKQPGPFAAGAEVRNEVTDRAIEEILYEMERIRETPVDPEELEKVKNYVTGSFPLQIETAAQVAQRIVTIEIYGLGKEYYNTFNSRILALTADDIQRTARKWLQPSRAAIVAAGRGNLLRNTLERFGPVELFDAEGGRIPNVESQAQDT